jgi:hypothetical protein
MADGNRVNPTDLFPGETKNFIGRVARNTCGLDATTKTAWRSAIQTDHDPVEALRLLTASVGARAGRRRSGAEPYF